SPFRSYLEWRTPEIADERWIHRVHSTEYRAFIEEACLSGRLMADSGDTPICPESYQVALKSAGGAMNAVDAVMRDGFQRAFACIRPPGHHARFEQAMGFCLFNNIAIAVAYAEEQYGLDRVCV